MIDLMELPVVFSSAYRRISSLFMGHILRSWLILMPSLPPIHGPLPSLLFPSWQWLLWVHFQKDFQMVVQVKTVGVSSLWKLCFSRRFMKLIARSLSVPYLVAPGVRGPMSWSTRWFLSNKVPQGQSSWKVTLSSVITGHCYFQTPWDSAQPHSLQNQLREKENKLLCARFVGIIRHLLCVLFLLSEGKETSAE